MMDEESLLKMGWKDAIFLSYLREQMTEGAASKWLGMDRLTFRTQLGQWLGELMDSAPVPVDGYTAVPSAVCNWTQDGYWGNWDSACGLSCQFTDGSPSDNEMVYCPKCGRKLVVGVAEEEE